MESKVARPDRTWIAGALLLGSCAVASARPAQIDNKLNLRHGPGQKHRVIVVMPAGANVTVGECHGEGARSSIVASAAMPTRCSAGECLRGARRGIDHTMRR